MTRRILVLPLLLGALLIVGGCATKWFVREQVQKSEIRIGQRLGRLETALGQETERSSRAGAEARSLSEEAISAAKRALALGDQALAKADESSGVAGQALDKADRLESRLTRFWSNRLRRHFVSEVVVAFGFGTWELNETSQTALWDVVKLLKAKPNLVVDVEGHTDDAGSRDYNLQLSQRRAEAVRRFLLENGVDLHRIHAIGLGMAHPVADNKIPIGRAQNRRAVVKVFTLAD